jgi:hypothetical protein
MASGPRAPHQQVEHMAAPTSEIPAGYRVSWRIVPGFDLARRSRRSQDDW